MNILTINAGSSTVKYAVFSLDQKKKTEEQLLGGLIEVPPAKDGNTAGYDLAFKHIMQDLEKNDLTVQAVAHRVVHGNSLTHSVLINKHVIMVIKHACHIAPLHDPHNLQGILACQKFLKCPQVAVFDTSFHAGLPAKASTYALPLWLSKKYGWKRYGFHGISHEYVAHEACKLLKKSFSSVKMVTCHLGNGASLAAIDHGKSVDTSMGFTPLEGLVMGTRSGDLDPALVCLLIEKGFREPAVYDLLNNQCGLKGLAGTNDMRELISRKDQKAVRNALDVYVYRIVKYLGAYIASLNGVDVIVFTAGVGEHCAWVRQEVMKQFGYLGIKIDGKKNAQNARVISTPESKVKVCVIPTNEALMMARETMKLVGKRC
ncbi:MAG: acetate kinase [archaeon GW2011_AR16]|nr:MAG: acetate kinase [archaeon GW2011_AR16]HII88282.1 acetate/propionate family kinase [Candidatus Woesearchaeota archaeon]